ncbi:MAG: peptidoglycan-binding protein [Stappia sp.]|uniref:L,D-transpeptidase family protein n=1 Tax=Stappia sp. TaxID=1870903 RepID=UPI000C3F9E1E|nr:L,D-transpeptidase family protein [Stappia sp.]MBM20864.1 peptidoglycan-binding protein [Stappia sp.]
MICTARPLLPFAMSAAVLAGALHLALAPVPALAQSGGTGGNATTGASIGALIEETRPADPLAAAIARYLDSTPAPMLDARFNAGAQDEADLGVHGFYEGRLYKPLWVSDEGINPHGEKLIAAFAASRADALDPAEYDVDELRRMASTAAGDDDLAALEVTLSNTFVAFSDHLTSGRVQPNEVNKALNIFPRAPNPSVVLEYIESAEDFDASLEALSPNTPNYARLKAALADYRAKAEAGGFTPVPQGETLKPGMTDTRLDTLRKRLAEQDLFTPGSHEGDVYDGALVEAVKLFQERHGLAVDGIIGRNTLAEINVPISQRIAQMELNMERRRWMPDDLGERYVFVNLADQNLKVVEDDKTVHTARVVVGKPYHATPVFSDKITYAEVNPFWTVPYSIATKEYLPQLQKNPGALAAKGIRIFSGNREVDPWSVAWGSYSRGNFPFTLRQDPGQQNALGRGKFMFPNKFNIYIHDTPAKALFSRAQRSFSHGCIRAEDPFALGGVLLSRDGWDKQKLMSVRDTDKRRVIKLKDPIPVHLTYLTAWVNKDGSVHFRRDIYDRDTVLAKAIANHRRQQL